MDYASVDFVVNTFERSYRAVLCPGYIKAMAEDHLFPFAKRIVLINNIEDRSDAEKLARGLRECGEIDEFYFVADCIDEALRQTGLTKTDLSPFPYYTDWALVAATLKGGQFMLHCDADVRLQRPFDWISPGIELLLTSPQIAVVNPSWSGGSLEKETRQVSGDFAIGYGFSDQIYLVQRKEFARPVYKYRAPISLRYPMSEQGRIYEQMVDSYMRVERRMRATLTTATYLHQSEEGASHPHLSGFARLAKLRNKLLLRIITWLPLKNPRWSI